MLPLSSMRAGMMHEPRGYLELRTLAMPANTNPSGDVFGGWIMSLMDLAAGMSAARHSGSRVVTAAASDFAFIAPVKVGDILCCYAELRRTGRTSMTFAIEVWVLRRLEAGQRTKVTQAEFTMVAVDEDGRPKPIMAETFPLAE